MTVCCMSECIVSMHLTAAESVCLHCMHANVSGAGTQHARSALYGRLREEHVQVRAERIEWENQVAVHVDGASAASCKPVAERFRDTAVEGKPACSTPLA